MSLRADMRVFAQPGFWISAILLVGLSAALLFFTGWALG